jgi:hypothetical protein
MANTFHFHKVSNSLNNPDDTFNQIKRISKEFPENSQRENSQKIPRKFPESSQKVSRKFPENFQKIPKKFPKNSPKIPKILKISNSLHRT